MFKLLPIVPEYVSAIINQLNSAGFEAYVVGGCVRDALLGRVPEDWDVCTSALPQDVINALSGYKIIKTGISHGTVTAIKGKNSCEITTFRCDGAYSDHRRPDSVDFTRDIKEDLSRRDFSVNSMAFSEKIGIIDLYNGQNDLKNKIIRCVGNPETRFTEDALRILRALRFSSVLNFTIEESTAKALLSCSNLINFVAKERIYNEFKKLLCGSSAGRIIQEYKEVFYKFLSFSEIEKNANFLNISSQDFSLRFALLFHGSSVDMALSDLSNLRAEKKTIYEVRFLIENNTDNHFKDEKSVKRALSLFGKEKTQKLLEYVSITHSFSTDKKFNVQTLIEELPSITLSDLAINGYDIMNLGVKEGAEIKELLSFALNSVLDNNCENKKSDLIKLISNKLTNKN